MRCWRDQTLVFNVITENAIVIVILVFYNADCGDDAPPAPPADPAGVIVPVMPVLADMSDDAQQDAIDINEWLESAIPIYSFVSLRIPDEDVRIEDRVHFYQVLDYPRKLITVNTLAKKTVQQARM